jgi:predicted ATPase
MLRRLRIKNFKLLRDVELEFSPDLPTVLIGANSSGKSTVIEVLDFLSRCAGVGLEEALLAHGGVTAVQTIGEEAPVEIVTHWGTDGVEYFVWAIGFRARPRGAFAIEFETLSRGASTLVSTSEDGRRSVVDETDPDGAAVFIQNGRKLAFETLVDPVRHAELALLHRLVGNVRVIGAISTAPRWARALPDRPSARDTLTVSTRKFVEREGGGLVIALYNLQIEHADTWGRLQRSVQGEFPFVKRIVFPPDPGGGRITFAIEDKRFPDNLLFASELSDGLVAFLCLLTLILHPDQGAALALDEPDAHLHPSAIRRLLSHAHDPHPRPRTLIIVTHSNAVLEELSDPAASIRVVESTPDGARIRKLDADALAAWRSQYTMSELRQTGLLDPSNGSYGNDE